METDASYRRCSEDATVKLLGVESRLRDRDDPRGALVALSTLERPQGDIRTAIRKGMLEAEAYRALGAADSAQAVIENLKQRYKDNPRATAMLERMSRGGRGPR